MDEVKLKEILMNTQQHVQDAYSFVQEQEIS